MHAIAGLHLETEQVPVEGEKVVAVRHDDVVAVTNQLPGDDAGVGGDHDPVIRGQDRTALLVGDVDAGVEVLVTEGRWLEYLTAGPEEQRDGALLQRPDQRVLRGVGGIGTGQREEVVLHQNCACCQAACSASAMSWSWRAISMSAIRCARAADCPLMATSSYFTWLMLWRSRRSRSC